MAARPSVRLAFVLLLLLAISSLASSEGSEIGGSFRRRDLLGYSPSARNSGGKAAANCRAMSSRSECERRSRWCRWCRSDALDDACFGSSEAWRLPQQVFSCDPNPTS